MKLIIAGSLAGLLAVAAISAQQPPSGQDVATLSAADAPPGAIWIDALDLTKSTGIRMSRRPPNPNAPPPAKPALGGVTYAHVFPTGGNSELWIDLKGQAARFVSMVGIDDVRKSGPGSVVFEVWVDGKKAADSGVMRSGDAPKPLSVDLKGAQRLALIVSDAGDGTREDDADWAGAMIVMQGGSSSKPETIAVPDEPAPPIASSAASARPRINNPHITGGTPGRPFLFLIPASGEGPLKFAAKNLPAGLQLDPNTGIISGSLQKDGRTDVQVTVTGPRGSVSSTLTIVGGKDALALTPPLGWNSWNVWAASVNDEKVRAAADAMIKSGLASHGFQYVNIDDAWEGQRDANGEITSNEKFPDMNALAGYVHSKGLKIGLYSSPGPRTCQRVYEGSYQHEAQDAATYAKWGFDYLKYDWCSYSQIEPDRTSLPGLKKPYVTMRAALDKVSRDIIYSLCQYGMGDVWEWGKEVGGNLWRTTGDITDTWASMSGIGFNQNGHEKFAGPGHWNDPDMLVVGKLGWGPRIHDTRLTKNEQITHISLWSLLSSPLLIGADMSQLDQFTLDLLGNDEVLGVNQDVLGKPAGRVAQNEHVEVWARPLADGTMAVGLFNRGPVAADATAAWSALGLSGTQRVRDLWQQKDLGTFSDSFTTRVPRHGAVLVKIGTPRQRS